MATLDSTIRLIISNHTCSPGNPVVRTKLSVSTTRIPEEHTHCVASQSRRYPVRGAGVAWRSAAAAAVCTKTWRSSTTSVERRLINVGFI